RLPVVLLRARRRCDLGVLRQPRRASPAGETGGFSGNDSNRRLPGLSSPPAQEPRPGAQRLPGSCTAALLPSAGEVVQRSGLVYRKDPRAVSDRRPSAHVPPGRAPGGAPGASAADLGGLAAASAGTETATFAPKHAGPSGELLPQGIPALNRISARWALPDRQQPGAECHPP